MDTTMAEDKNHSLQDLTCHSCNCMYFWGKNPTSTSTIFFESVVLWEALLIKFACTIITQNCMLVFETWTGAWQQRAVCLVQMAWLRQARICGQPAMLNAPLEGLEVGSAATIHHTNLWNHPGTPYYGSPFWSSQSTSVRLVEITCLYSTLCCRILWHASSMCRHPRPGNIDLQHVNAIGVTAIRTI